MSTASAAEARVLERGAAALEIALMPAALAQTQRLLDELQHWNRAYNLTSIDARDAMLTHHVLDSWSIAPWLRGARILDVGTGAGFPGLPLAILAPEREFTLLDSNGKKVRFVAHAARTLGLANVRTVHARAEAHRAQLPYDTVMARAFAPLPLMLERIASLCGPATRVLAMKGRRSETARTAVPEGWQIEADVALHVPGLAEERHLLVLQRTPAPAPTLDSHP